MSEYAIARGPVPTAPPEIEVAGWAVSGRHSDAALTIADWTPLTKILLRAPLPDRDVTNAPGPRGESCISHVPMTDLGVRYGAAAHQDCEGVDVLLIGWGPDEWLALGPPGSQAFLVEHLRHTGGTVVDVTHAGALLRITGDRAPDLLARECALDLSDRAAPNGSAFRTAVSHVAAGLIRDDIDATLSYLVHCEWSLGRYLYESLLDAGNEFGVETDGLRSMQSHWAIRNARER